MIKFLDLKAVNQKYIPDIQKAFNRILDSGWYLLGKELDAFEADFADYCQAKYAVGVASGLDALSLIIRAYGFGEGDEIIVPSNTFIASVLSITSCRAEPVFVEPNPLTFLIEPDKIEDKITDRTKAVMPVHLYGQACDMEKICSLAKKYKLKIIDDAAQAHGAIHIGTAKIKTFQEWATGYSFYPAKNLGAMADAGVVVTNDNDLAEKIKALRNYGYSKRYHSKYQGSNSRMDELQAAVLKIKLKGLDEDNTRRREIANQYLETIVNEKVTLPKPPKNPENHVWHLFVIKTKHRDNLKLYLEQKGIQTQIHYPIPPHKQECYRKYNNLSLPIAEQLSNEILSLPISPVMTEKDVKKIAEAVNDWN